MFNINKSFLCIILRLFSTVIMDVAPFQPFLVCMDSPDRQQVAGRKVNVACTFNLGPDCTGINLQMLAQMFPELGGKCVIERMAAVFFRMSNNMACLRNRIVGLGLDGMRELGRDQTQSIYRRALVLLYAPGNAVITGMADEAMSRAMAHSFCRIVTETTGMPAVMTDFQMTNIVINFQMQHGVSLDLLRTTSALATRIDYTPSKFPMAVIHSASCYDATLPQHDKRTTALVSSRGCVNITGISSLEEGILFMREIFPELWKYQVDEFGALLHIQAPPVRPSGPTSLSLMHAGLGAALSWRQELAGAEETGSASMFSPPLPLASAASAADEEDEPDPGSEELLEFMGLDECMPPETSFSQLTSLLVHNALGSFGKI
jgi:TATA-box binding protein (TBP) (component of TFIID and TFIIIB)